MLACFSAEWKEREKVKHIDPAELVERYGLTFIPTAYTKDAVSLVVHGHSMPVAVGYSGTQRHVLPSAGACASELRVCGAS